MLELPRENLVLSRRVRERIRIATKAKEEIEAAVCQGIKRIEDDFMGWGLKDIHACLVGNHLLVLFQGIWTEGELQLVKSASAGKGWDVLKQVRSQMFETGRPVLEELVQEVTGVKALSMHYDINNLTGKEIVLFTLAGSPFEGDPQS